MWRPEARPERLSDDQERELAALDRLLGGPVGPGEDEAGLGALVVAVRDDRPPLRPAFAAELDARVAAGFPRRAAGPVAGWAGRVAGAGRRVAGAAGRVGSGRWLTGLGAAAALAVAVAVVAVVAGSTGRPQSGAGKIQRAEPPAAGAGVPAVRAPAPATGAPALRAPAPATGSAAGQRAAAPPPPAAPFAASPPIPAPAVAGAGGARAVQRDATLGLVAARGQVQRVTDRAIAAIDRLGGIVQSSQVALDDQGSSQATLELQVPSAALDRTLAALSALAQVSSRTQDTLDITDATGAARDRLAESRAQRHALLRQLARATTPNQVASIRAQLGLVAGRIAADQTQLASLLQRGALAHVSLTIAENQQAAASDGGGSGWSPGAALDEALGVLEAVFAVLVVALAGLVPAVIVGGLGWAAARPLRRRRREAALARPG